jgi:hypothetical protein
MNTKKEKKSGENSFNLPQYLMLAKGSMWFDIDGENSSGIKLYAMKKQLVSREFEMITTYDQKGIEVKYPKATPIPEDEHSNHNVLDYGKVESQLPWYADISEIPPHKLSRVLLAFKHGILVEADPKNPPKENKQEVKTDFTLNQKGERVFVGKNVEMYKKLQNLKFTDLRDFINNCPKKVNARENLQDLLSYEVAGHNPLARPRLEVLKLIRDKLAEYGPGISSIRINEDD